MERYRTREEFVDALRDRLPRDGWPEELRGPAAEALAGGGEPEPGEAGTGLELRAGTWFLRDDDVPFFQTVAVVGPLVATLLATGGLAAPVVVGGAASLLGSAWKVWRKGGRLSQEQVAALTILQAEGPMSEGDLAARLDRDEVRPLLEQLRDVELNDGTGAALVRRTGDGRWRAVNV